MLSSESWSVIVGIRDNFVRCGLALIAFLNLYMTSIQKDRYNMKNNPKH